MAPVNKPKHKGKALLAGALSGVFEISCTVSKIFAEKEREGE